MSILLKTTLCILLDCTYITDDTRSLQCQVIEHIKSDFFFSYITIILSPILPPEVAAPLAPPTPFSSALHSYAVLIIYSRRLCKLTSLLPLMKTCLDRFLKLSTSCRYFRSTPRLMDITGALDRTGLGLLRPTPHAVSFCL